MKLSDHFTLDEFLISQTATRHSIDMTPSAEVQENLQRLVDSCMEPLRVATGRPIFISSGFRPDMLNNLIGGSKTSEHRFGNACDFRVSGMSPYDVCVMIRDMRLPYDQNIHEFGRWTHLGVNDILRGEDLTAYKDRGKTRYVRGIKRMDEL